LKFIGEQTPEQVEAITERLRRVEGSAFEIRSAGYGFFPTAKAPRVFWIGIQAGPQLAELAGRSMWPSPNLAFRAKIGLTVRI
jgi:2'-5' RNA ligase